MNFEGKQFRFDTLIQEGILQIGDGYRAKNDELGGTGLIFLRSAHVRESHIDFSGVDRFHSMDMDQFSQKVSVAGDVMVTTKGNSTGRTSFVTKAMPPFVYSPHISFWRSLDKDRLDPGFLRAWSNSEEFRSQLRAMCYATDMAPYLSLTDQKSLRIFLPRIQVQRFIAGVYGDLDDRITLLKDTSTTLEAIAEALFKSWFVDFDPVRAKMEGRTPEGVDEDTAALFPDDFEQSELGLVPQGWRTISLKEVFISKNERVLERDIPVYASTNEGLIPRDKLYKKQLSASLSKNKVVRQGDFVFGLSREVLNFGLMRDEIGSVSSAYKVYAVDENLLSSDLLERMIRAKANYFFNAVSASSREGQSVSEQGLGLLKVVQASMAVQQAYGVIQKSLQAKAKLLLDQAQTLTTIRDMLLPRLISGELGLPEMAQFTEAMTGT